MSIIKSYAAKEAGADLSLWEYDAGELLPEDVEVEVEYCGICHSDLSMIDNEWGMSSYPLVAGHEVIGRVAALGSAAQDKGLKIGQKVGIGWTARSCGHCDACISGNQINCLEGSVPTIMNRGGFADKLRADWQWVIPLPESIDLASAGPMLCGGITVFKPLLTHHVTATSRVGVIGIGGLGHIAIKLLRAMGAEVTAFSSNPAKEQEVLAMGADRVEQPRSAGVNRAGRSVRSDHQHRGGGSRLAAVLPGAGLRRQLPHRRCGNEAIPGTGLYPDRRRPQHLRLGDR